MAVRELLIKWGFEVDDSQLKSLETDLNKIKSLAKGLAIGFGVMAAATAVFLKEASDMEQVEVAFETMLGSVELAKKTIQDLRDFAVNTPFNFKGVVDLSKRLLAFGFQAEELIPTMTRLGNIAAGVGKEKLPFLVLALGQVRTAGKLTGQELRQFTEAGVPLLEELAKTMGKSLTEIESLKRAGKISFNDVENALKSLSEEGGRFADLMLKQSKTLGGLVSNVIDMLQIFAAEVGKELLPAAKEIVKIFLAWFAVNKKIIKQNMVKIFKSFIKATTLGIKALRSFIDSLLFVTDIFGGLANVILIAKTAILAFIGLQILSALGSMLITLFKIVQAFRLIGLTALIAQAKALLFPILIGAAFVALLLIIEDFIGFLQGKDSLVGLLLKKMFGEDTMKEIRNDFNSFINEFKEGLKELGKGFSFVTFGNFTEGLKVVGELIDSVINKFEKLKSIFVVFKEGTVKGLSKDTEAIKGFVDKVDSFSLIEFLDELDTKAGRLLGVEGGRIDSLAPATSNGGNTINQPVKIDIKVEANGSASAEDIGESVEGVVLSVVNGLLRNTLNVVQDTQVS